MILGVACRIWPLVCWDIFFYTHFEEAFLFCFVFITKESWILSIFLFKFLKLIYLFILLYNIVLVFPYIDLNPPWVYMCSPSWTPLPPHSPSSGSSQCTSPKHPVSWIELGLVIHSTYDNLHNSMPFSYIILLSPSPTESKKLFNTSVSLLLSCCLAYRIIVTIFLNSIYMR